MMQIVDLTMEMARCFINNMKSFVELSMKEADHFAAGTDPSYVILM